MRTTSILGAAFLALSSFAPAQENRAPFDAPVLTFPTNTAIVRVPDLNGDGVVDAVGWFWTDDQYNDIRVTVFRGNGNGTFAYLGMVLDGLSVSSSATMTWGLECGSFDRNGREEFACAFDNKVFVFTSDATGIPQQLTSWVEPWPVKSMVVADFDGDGLDDVAVAGSGVRIYLNRGTLFQFASAFASGTEIRSGELDAVAGPDLYALDGASLRVLGVANGVLSPGPVFTHGIALDQTPRPLAGDIDGDGDDDILMFSDLSECVVVRQVAPGSFVVEPKTVGGPARLLADIDSDGDLDGICCGSGGGPYPAVNDLPSNFRIAINDGLGGFTKSYTVKGLGSLRIAGAKDLDGDGDNDLVGGRCVLFNRGDFDVDPTPKLASVPADGLVLVDFERDGDPDFARLGNPWVVAFFTGKNDGLGNLATGFVPFTTSPTGGGLYGPGYAGDFDGDGDEDVICYDGSGPSFVGMRFVRNAGGGGFTSGGLAAAPGVPFESGSIFDGGPGPSVTGDLDGDGDLDLAVGRVTGLNSFSIWLNDGAAFFTKTASVLFTSIPSAIVDLDGDGKADVVGGSIYGFGGVSLCYGKGDGTVDPTVTLGGTEFFALQDRLAIADLDGNGLLDVAAYNHDWQAESLHLWMQTAPRAFTKNTIAFSDAELSSSDGVACRVFAFDADGDSDLDLVASPQHWSNTNAYILFNDGTGSFSIVSQQILANPRFMADMDGDTDPDLIGDHVIRSVLKDVPDYGYRRQYGVSKKGLGGMAPTLGAVGPFLANGTIELRLTGGRGGSVALFCVGAAESAQPNWPAFGVTGYAFPPFVALLVPLDGTAGEAGTGDFIVPIVVPPAASGFPFFHQAFVYDVAAPPGIFSHTNGLELRYP